MKQHSPLLPIFLILLFLTDISSQQLSKDPPIIGIFSLNYQQTTLSYINGVYVKFVQISGAQVVPIYAYESSTEEILDLLKQLNGVIFPGGAMSFAVDDQWTINAHTVFEYAKEQNNQGNVFPIFGFCLGLEIMTYLSANFNFSIFFDTPGDEGVTHPLHRTQEKSEFYEQFSQQQLNLLTTGKGISYFNHHRGITVNTYNNHQKLKAFWKLTAWVQSSERLRFAASFEARQYPFYLLQYHPEMASGEWVRFSVDRSKKAIEVSQAVSGFFIEKAKQNKSHQEAKQEMISEKIIDNYEPTFHPRKKTDATEIYILDEKNSHN